MPAMIAKTDTPDAADTAGTTGNPGCVVVIGDPLVMVLPDIVIYGRLQE